MTGVSNSVTVKGDIYVVTLVSTGTTVFTVNGRTGSVSDNSGAAVTGNDVVVVSRVLRSRGHDDVANAVTGWWNRK